MSGTCLTAALAALLIGTSVAAAQTVQDSGTSRIQDREFLLGVPDDALRREPYFLPIDRVPWLWDLTQSDPLLSSVVVHVVARPPNHVDLWTVDFVRSHSGPNRETFPGYKFSGQQSWSRSGSRPKDYFLLPAEEPYDFMARCARSDVFPDELSFCGVSIKYQPDNSLFIRARVYSPEYYADHGLAFAAMSQRLNAIVACLDVTDTPPEDRDLDATVRCVEEELASPRN